MVDTLVSKAGARKGVWVRLPSSVLSYNHNERRLLICLLQKLEHWSYLKATNH